MRERYKPPKGRAQPLSGPGGSDLQPSANGQNYKPWKGRNKQRGGGDARSAGDRQARGTGPQAPPVHCQAGGEEVSGRAGAPTVPRTSSVAARVSVVSIILNVRRFIGVEPWFTKVRCPSVPSEKRTGRRGARGGEKLGTILLCGARSICQLVKIIPRWQELV